MRSGRKSASGQTQHPTRPVDLSLYRTPRRSIASTDAIVVLKDDHKVILRAFRDFENADDNAHDNAHKTEGDLVAKIIELLTVHTYIENGVTCPRVRELVPELEDDVLESYEEHHVADVLVMELMGMKPTDERFTAKTTVIIETSATTSRRRKSGSHRGVKRSAARSSRRSAPRWPRPTRRYPAARPSPVL
jgi:hypothetical protein